MSDKWIRHMWITKSDIPWLQKPTLNNDFFSSSIKAPSEWQKACNNASLQHFRAVYTSTIDILEIFDFGKMSSTDHRWIEDAMSSRLQQINPAVKQQNNVHSNSQGGAWVFYQWLSTAEGNKTPRMQLRTTAYYTRNTAWKQLHNIEMWLQDHSATNNMKHNRIVHHYSSIRFTLVRCPRKGQCLVVDDQSELIRAHDVTQPWTLLTVALVWDPLVCYAQCVCAVCCGPPIASGPGPAIAVVHGIITHGSPLSHGFNRRVEVILYSSVEFLERVLRRRLAIAVAYGLVLGDHSSL